MGYCQKRKGGSKMSDYKVIYNCDACGQLQVVYEFDSERGWWCCKNCLSKNDHNGLVSKIVRRDKRLFNQSSNSLSKYITGERGAVK